VGQLGGQGCVLARSANKRRNRSKTQSNLVWVPCLTRPSESSGGGVAVERTGAMSPRSNEVEGDSV
jgi:hypothetical protein